MDWYRGIGLWITTITLFLVLFVGVTYLVLTLPPFNRVVYPESVVIVAPALALLISVVLSFVFYRRQSGHRE